MKAWLEGIAGSEFAPALMWTVIALIALLVLLVVVRIVRGLTFGTFVAGGRNRKARLAVMDATAVDSQRRLAGAAHRGGAADHPLRLFRPGSPRPGS